MAIRGRRYPPRTLVRGIVFANPVPRGFVRWSRPNNRPPFRQIHLPVTVLTQSNTPGPPIASVHQWHRNLLPASFNSRIVVVRSMAGVQPNAVVFAFRQHRPVINVQNTTHRVTVMHSNIVPAGNPIGHRTYQRAQVISRPVVNRALPVRIVNPPVPQVNKQMYDMNRLARQRTMVPMIYPNRRTP